MDKIPIILLAAGGSSRMGEPKQLLKWGNQTLLEHQVAVLQKTGSPVLVVLGAVAEKIIPLLQNDDVAFIVNNNWEMGMGTSIVAGVRKVSDQFPDARGVLMALVDQPLLPLSHYKKLLEAFQPDKQQIIASHSENGWTGVPALFDRCYFKELIQLRKEEGAKKLLKKYASKVRRVDGGELLADLDTPESYQIMLRLIGEKPSNSAE